MLLGHQAGGLQSPRQQVLINKSLLTSFSIKVICDCNLPMISRRLAVHCSRLVGLQAPLRAYFSTVGPSSTKTYNLENQLMPFKLNSLWDNVGTHLLPEVPGTRRKFWVEDKDVSMGKHLMNKKASWPRKKRSRSERNSQTSQIRVGEPTTLHQTAEVWHEEEAIPLRLHQSVSDSLCD